MSNQAVPVAHTFREVAEILAVGIIRKRRRERGIIEDDTMSMGPKAGGSTNDGARSAETGGSR